MKWQRERSQGFTYVEILVCIAILACMVGPLNHAYLASIRTRVSAAQIEQVTFYAERLLQEIKEKMTKDITYQQKALGGRIASPSIDQIDGVIQYLRDYEEIGASQLRKRQASLNQLLSDFSTEDYETDQYAYEVALWRLSDVDLSLGTFTLNQDTLKKASCFYSDQDKQYQFLETNYSSGSNLVSFKINKEMLKAFWDEELKYIPYPTKEDKKIKLLDLCTVKVKEDGKEEGILNVEIKNRFSRITFDIESIKDSKGQLVGYSMMNRCSHFVKEPGSTYRSVIDLDIRSLLRKADLSELTTYDSFTFKFVNTMPYDQIIRIWQNVNESESLDRINEKFNVTVLDQGVGKTTITRINDTVPYENYLIAIVVRDKNPIQGQAGKVVKKMLDVYSYHALED